MQRAATVIALAAGLAMAVAPSSAQADECDDVVSAIEKRMDEIRATRKQGNSHTTVCARLGRISGLTQAIRIVAEHCMEESKKRDGIIASAIESEKAFEVDNVCR